MCETSHALKKRVLNWTARIIKGPYTGGVSNKNSESLSKMKTGDVLVSHSTAVREHVISVIPNAAHAISPTHDKAVSDGRSEADVLGVDAWLTEDHTHVVKIASHRPRDDHDARTHGLVYRGPGRRAWEERARPVVQDQTCLLYT